MTTVIGVRFKKVGKVYYFDPCGVPVKTGQSVIVETARGIECGVCTMSNTPVEDSKIVPPLKKLVRIATQNDLEVAAANERQAHEAFQIARRKIEQHGLDMHLVAVECTFDLNKILFYFTADGRVDFRDLVKDLASIFRTRIELRQIGVRDEAKMIGGLGICGRELCCSSYLDEFQPVSINMAKEQNLSLNPTKISGTCGRLMCCLKYEHEAYVDLQKVTPKNDSLVETPEGVGTVLSTQMLRGLCKVLLDGEEEPRTFACTECKVLRSGRARKCNGSCNTKQTEIDPMDTAAPAAFSEAPVEVQQEPRRKQRRERSVGQEMNEKSEAQTPNKKNEAEKTERPAREKNGQPRLVKSVPKKETADPPVRQPIQRAILVKSAPKKEEEPLSEDLESEQNDKENSTEKKRRRRRRAGMRRKKNAPGESGSFESPSEE